MFSYINLTKATVAQIMFVLLNAFEVMKQFVVNAFIVGVYPVEFTNRN